jgi:glucosylceramidase
MLDADNHTYWTTGAPQAVGQWIEIDMGRSSSFRQIEMDSSSSPNDYADAYRIYTAIKIQ